MTPFKPSAFASRILRKLAAGSVGRGRGDGTYQVGAATMPGSLARELALHDLAAASNGELIITSAGRAFVRRNLQKTKTRGDAVRAGDPCAFRRQHQSPHVAERVIDGRRRRVQLNSAESPLIWLAQRKDRVGKPFLESEQVEAGERLRRDFVRAGMTPRMTPGYDGAPVNDRGGRAFIGLNHTEAQLSARRRFLNATNSVGPELSGVLLRVCCFLEGIAEAERQLDWPVRSGKVVLRIALDHLVRHYRAPRTQ